MTWVEWHQVSARNCGLLALLSGPRQSPGRQESGSEFTERMNILSPMVAERPAQSRHEDSQDSQGVGRRGQEYLSIWRDNGLQGLSRESMIQGPGETRLDPWFWKGRNVRTGSVQEGRGTKDGQWISMQQKSCYQVWDTEVCQRSRGHDAEMQKR